MTTPTIRDHCATLAGDVLYLLACIRDGSFWWGEKSEQPEITPAPTGWTPGELPGLSCWYSADDGLYVDSVTGQQFLRDLSGNGGRMIVGDGLTVSKVNGNTVFNKEEA